MREIVRLVVQQEGEQERERLPKQQNSPKVGWTRLASGSRRDCRKRGVVEVVEVQLTREVDADIRGRAKSRTE